MQLSARNIIQGKIVKLFSGQINTEVTVELPGGDQIVSIITKTSAAKLDLSPGKEVYAIIKATNVMIGVDE